MGNLAEVALPMQHLEQFVQTAVAKTVTDEVGGLLEPSGRALSDILDRAVVEGIERSLSGLAKQYAAQVLGAERSERAAQRQGYRSGTRYRRLVTPLGTLEVGLVKSRTKTLTPPFLAHKGRFLDGVKALGRQLWARGLSYRGISAVAAETLGGDASHETVAGWVQDTQDEVLRWLNRPIPPDIRYLVVDGLWVSVKRQTARKEVVLVAVGITADGRREVLDAMPAPSESAAHWATLLARLRGRGLTVSQLRLVISDGCEGIIAAVGAELRGVPRQRCVVHKVRNIVGQAPRSLKSSAPKEASAIWKAPNKSEARVRAAAFIERYKDVAPKLAAIISDDFEATLTFFDLDACLWRTMCSTNVSERINREMRRKFDDMGACRGEHAVVRTAALVAIKLSDDWKDEVVRGFKKTRRNVRSAA
jgi:putative transposase